MFHKITSFLLIELSPAVSAAIIAAHSRFQKWSTIIVTCLYSFVLVFFYIHIFAVNGRIFTDWTLKDLLLWAIVLPTLFAYDIYGFFGIATFVLLATQLVAIRQQALLGDLKQILLSRKIQRSKKRTQKSGQQLLRFQQYLAINRSVALLAKFTKQCSSFWSTPLTVYFVGFITIQCYFAFILFFVPNIDLLNRAFFLYVLLTVEAFQFVLITEFAKLSTLNGRLEKANADFYV